jgi:hypothetical protein
MYNDAEEQWASWCIRRGVGEGEGMGGTESNTWLYCDEAEEGTTPA